MNTAWTGAFNGDRMEIKPMDNAENALDEWVNVQSARQSNNSTEEKVKGPHVENQMKGLRPTRGSIDVLIISGCCI